MGLFVVSSLQRSKGTASSTPVWNRSPQVQTASLILTAACSLIWTPVTQTWMWSNLPDPIHCKYGRPCLLPTGPELSILPECLWSNLTLGHCSMTMILTVSLNLELGRLVADFSLASSPERRVLTHCFLALRCDALSCWDGFGDGCCLCWLLGNVQCYFCVCFHTEQSVWSNPSCLPLSNCSVIMTSRWRL